MADVDFTVMRLRELHLEAKAAMEALTAASLRLRSAIDRIEGELEHLEYSQASDGETKGKRPAFASALQGMCYVAIWIAVEMYDAVDGVTEEQFLPLLEDLRDKKGNPPDLEKVSECLLAGRGKHIVVERGFYRLLKPGSDAVRNHWGRVSGIPDGRKPPPL